MSDVVIRAEGLGKKYRIGHRAERAGGYVALRDVMADAAKGLVRSARDMFAGRQLVAGDEVEDFWALKDVNFEIERGDVVGIIGRNGAGKSTLLKILSRITEPSTGRVEIKGRVASLLEVGTGFHPELTGRENIYLNGAILGMTRAEIKKKFDEIIAFAEVEKFLDTPVKRYSSGMYVRLAFAVAAHLEPEILVVDEVLAVGDAEFQKKCLGKMGEVAGQGRTVLFVSHNLQSMQRLCTRGVCLVSGAVYMSDTIDNAIAGYNNGVPGARAGYKIITEQILSPGISVRVDEGLLKSISSGSVKFNLELICHRDEIFYFIRLIINTISGIRVAVLDARELFDFPMRLRKGHTLCVFEVRNLNLVEGNYTVTASIGAAAGQKNFDDLMLLSVSMPDNAPSTGVPADWRGIAVYPSKITFTYQE